MVSIPLLARIVFCTGSEWVVGFAGVRRQNVPIRMFKKAMLKSIANLDLYITVDV